MGGKYLQTLGPHGAWQGHATWGTEGLGAQVRETVILTGALVPLLTEGRRKQDGLIIEFAFLTLAICITNPCKVKSR